MQVSQKLKMLTTTLNNIKFNNPDLQPHHHVLPQQDAQVTPAAGALSAKKNNSKSKDPPKRPRGRPRKYDKDGKDSKRKSCLFCDKTYTYTRNRNLHMIERHMGECRARGMIKPCGSCDEVFVSSKGRRMHLESAHGVKRIAKKVTHPMSNAKITYVTKVIDAGRLPRAEAPRLPHLRH